MAGFHDCQFIAGSANLDALPPVGLPEIAFAGRSNVGKSSLINAVVGRKALARTSQTPGRTRQLNFFAIDQTFTLVDLPGYGYAKASKKDVRSWMNVTRAYLCGRPNLRRVLLLLDLRRDKPSVDDLEWMDMLDEAAVSYQVVFTKADKCKKSAIEQRLADWELLAKRHPAAFPEAIITSSEEATGIKALRQQLMQIAQS